MKEPIFTQLLPDGELTPVLTYINDNTFLLKGKEITYAQLVHILLSFDLDSLPEESTLTKLESLNCIQVVPKLQYTKEEWDTSNKSIQAWLDQAHLFGCTWAVEAFERTPISNWENEVASLGEALLWGFNWTDAGNHDYWNTIHNMLIAEKY